LQAAWCVARRDGRKNAKLTEFTTGTVAVNEATRCLPGKANVARYRELQAAQDALSTSLRESGVFARQRALAGAV
jgi:xylulokinase